MRSFRMPDCRFGIPFFVVFRGRTMGLCRKFVLLGGFAVRLVQGHGISSLEENFTPPLLSTSQASLCWTAGFSMG